MKFWPMKMLTKVHLSFVLGCQIETEKMLIEMVGAELEHRKKTGNHEAYFQGQSYFFGCDFPSIFDNLYYWREEFLIQANPPNPENFPLIFLDGENSRVVWVS